MADCRAPNCYNLILEEAAIADNKFSNWLKFRIINGAAEEELESSLPGITKIGETLTPNLRALRLALTVSEQLLSMSVPSASVVSRALDITETYCEKPVHVDIVSNVIMLSQLRGLESEPLTMIRPVVPRTVNNMTIQLLQDMVYQIRKGRLGLDEAEKQLDQILKGPITYPSWSIPLANAALAAGVDLLFTTNWRIILVTFVIVWLVDRLALFLYKRAFSGFFRQAVAAFFVTLGAAVINFLAGSGIDFFDGMNPTVIVVGGIIMLLSGLAIVGAIQDAIEEYYLTAAARVFQVTMLTAGIVMGVLIGLYAAHKIGIGIAVSPNPLSLTGLHFQVIGGAIAAGAFAVSTQTRVRAVLWAALLGAAALVVMYSARNFGISSVPATGVAALVVGFLAKFFSWRWRTPTSGITAAAIVPLVPGLSLYTALMQLVHYPPGSSHFFSGVGTLFTALGIALAIAAGASFGNMIARTPEQRRTFIRNLMPFAAFTRNQLRFSRRYNIVHSAIRRPSKRHRRPSEENDFGGLQ